MKAQKPKIVDCLHIDSAVAGDESAKYMTVQNFIRMF